MSGNRNEEAGQDPHDRSGEQLIERNGMAHERGPQSGNDIRLLPLHDEHVRLGARLFAFGDRLMPLSYTSILAEHLQVRRRAGLFDVSHMGRLVLHGPGALEAVTRLVATNLVKLPVGRAQYTVLLTPEGGIRDDLIVYREEERILLIVNAANTDADVAWIAEHLPSGVVMDDITLQTGLFALQGPEALGLLSRLAGLDLTSMKPFTHAHASIGGADCIIARTGYTGEQGAEVMVPSEAAATIWNGILAAESPGSVLPCGLGARDTLRLEAGLLLYGQDIDLSTTPYEAGLEWLVSLDRDDFVGREALLSAKEKGPGRVLLGIITRARSIPRHGDEVSFAGESVGKVTSGSYSPVLGHPIALAYIRPEHAHPGRQVQLDVRGRQIPGELTEPRFYQRGVTPLPPEKGDGGHG
jgi:aminomethyltransferase